MRLAVGARPGVDHRGEAPVAALRDRAVEADAGGREAGARRRVDGPGGCVGGALDDDLGLADGRVARGGIRAHRECQRRQAGQVGARRRGREERGGACRGERVRTVDLDRGLRADRVGEPRGAGEDVGRGDERRRERRRSLDTAAADRRVHPAAAELGRAHAVVDHRAVRRAALDGHQMDVADEQARPCE